VSDIDTVVVNSLKALDPEWPIREADTKGERNLRQSMAVEVGRAMPRRPG